MFLEKEKMDNTIDQILEKLNVALKLNESSIKEISEKEILFLKKSKGLDDMKEKINILMDKTGHEGIEAGLNTAVDIVNFYKNNKVKDFGKEKQA